MPVYGVAPNPVVEGAATRPVPTAGSFVVSSHARRRVHTAFVLSGGGNRGACQVGMLRALSERGIVPDLVVGTSIGAVNAACFAGQPTLEGTYLAAEMWRKIGAEDVFPKSLLHGSWRFLARREAAYPIDGLRELVGGFLRFERLEDSPVPLTVVATRLDDGVEEWMSEGPALDAVLASAALPAVFPPVERGGTRYIDGGVVDNVPLSVALAAGARRVYVLMCSGVDYRPFDFDRPYEALLAAFGQSIHARLGRDLAAVPAEADVVVFEQSGVTDVLWQDFSHTEELLERGYLDARTVLERAESQIQMHRGKHLGARWWSRPAAHQRVAKRKSRSARKP